MYGFRIKKDSKLELIKEFIDNVYSQPKYPIDALPYLLRAHATWKDFGTIRPILKYELKASLKIVGPCLAQEISWGLLCCGRDHIGDEYNSFLESYFSIANMIPWKNRDSLQRCLAELAGKSSVPKNSI
jgi:hypothetical protein